MWIKLLGTKVTSTTQTGSRKGKEARWVRFSGPYNCMLMNYTVGHWDMRRLCWS